MEAYTGGMRASSRSKAGAFFGRGEGLTSDVTAMPWRCLGMRLGRQSQEGIAPGQTGAGTTMLRHAFRGGEASAAVMMRAWISAEAMRAAMGFFVARRRRETVGTRGVGRRRRRHGPRWRSRAWAMGAAPGGGRHWENACWIRGGPYRANRSTFAAILGGRSLRPCGSSSSLVCYWRPFCCFSHSNRQSGCHPHSLIDFRNVGSVNICFF